MFSINEYVISFDYGLCKVVDINNDQVTLINNKTE